MPRQDGIWIHADGTPQSWRYWVGVVGGTVLAIYAFSGRYKVVIGGILSALIAVRCLYVLVRIKTAQDRTPPNPKDSPDSATD